MTDLRVLKKDDDEKLTDDVRTLIAHLEHWQDQPPPTTALVVVSAWDGHGGAMSASYSLGRELTQLEISGLLAEVSTGHHIHSLFKRIEHFEHVPAGERGGPTVGQVAFEAYNSARGGVNYQGNKTPDWPDLPEGIREAWEQAAVAAIAAGDD
mgnify:CR=1 FL=1